MADWGLPDWKDATKYARFDHWDFYRWRWEFFRRRSDLRTYFDARSEETYQRYKNLNDKPFPEPNEPGFCAIVDVDARNEFGYSALPNPRIGDQPFETLWTWTGDGAGNIIHGDWEGGSVGELLDAIGLQLSDEQAFILAGSRTHKRAIVGETEIAITFDLDKPLEPQIVHARQILRDEQKLRHEKLLQKRRRQELWPAYLRVIDARADGATWSQIANILPCHTGSRTPQDARRFHLQACELMIKF
jgi:hypothetical protein